MNLFYKYISGNEITVNKHTPVHYAVFSENAEILKILQNHGCKMQEMDGEKRTPLKLAIHFGRYLMQFYKYFYAKYVFLKFVYMNL